MCIKNQLNKTQILPQLDEHKNAYNVPYFQYMVPLKKYVFPLCPHTMAPSIFSSESGRPRLVSGFGNPLSSSLPLYR